jgi:hypothetical protein
MACNAVDSDRAVRHADQKHNLWSFTTVSTSAQLFISMGNIDDQPKAQ